MSLEGALEQETTPAVIKTLQLLVALMSTPGEHRAAFLSKVKEECTASLVTGAQYTAIDPVHGEKPSAMVRKLSTQVSSLSSSQFIHVPEGATTSL